MFFFNDPATTEIYTLSLHDALPILAPDEPIALRMPVESVDDVLKSLLIRDPSGVAEGVRLPAQDLEREAFRGLPVRPGDRKSTRLNSSHANISYAVFCLKKQPPTRYLGGFGREPPADVHRLLGCTAVPELAPPGGG